MSFPASTKAGGTCMGTPDTCNVPSPAGPVPTPFPNIGQCATALNTTTSVKIGNMPALTIKSTLPMSSGDEAGVSGGLVSGVNMNQIAYRMGSTVVSLEGNPAAKQLSTTAHNGSNPNMPAGSQLAPSQGTVLIA